MEVAPRKHRVLAVAVAVAVVVVKAVSIKHQYDRNLTPTVFLSLTSCRVSSRKRIMVTSHYYPSQ